MKKLTPIYLAIAILAILQTACSQESPMDEQAVYKTETQTRAADFNISEAEALALADKATGNQSTRSYGIGASITPLYADSEATRASDSTIPLDTLAYIVNYPNNGGFSIISKDNRINPVLAYSYTGNFTLSNEIAKEQFVDRIKGYMDIKCVGNVKYDDSSVEDACRIVNNMVTITLGQDSPFNKYVLMDHLNCPVGCVAVASALVMMHSKEKLAYGNILYYFSDMRKYIAEGPQTEIGTPSSGINPTSTTGIGTDIGMIHHGIVTNYFQAIDYTAKLLYQIGKDVDMSYHPNGSGANSYNAYLLIKNLGFNVTTGYETMNLNSVSNHLENNSIIYMRGTGHAWVADGCRYCIDINTKTKRDIYLHCDWGWYGSCNGYFTGDVFATSAGHFTPANFFAVKREVSN